MGVEWKTQVRVTFKGPHFKFLLLPMWEFEFADFKLLGSKLFVVAVLCYPGPWLRLIGIAASFWSLLPYGRGQSVVPLLHLLDLTFLSHLLSLPPGWVDHSPGHILHSFHLSCCPVPVPSSGIPCSLRLENLCIFLRAPSVRLSESAYMGLLQTRTTLNSSCSTETSLMLLKKWEKKREQACTL